MLHDAGEHGGQLLHGRELVPAGRGGGQAQVWPGTQIWARLEGALGYLPLRKLRRPHLLPRGIHVAHHKVFGDLLHVLKVEEGVETQLVCKDTPQLWLSRGLGRPMAPEGGPQPHGPVGKPRPKRLREHSLVWAAIRGALCGGRGDLSALADLRQGKAS